MHRLVPVAAVVLVALAAAPAPSAGPSQRVTMIARPTVGPLGPVTLSGSVDSGRANEIVDIYVKDCGQRFFRGVASTRTGQGGVWQTDYYPGISTALRAVWNGHESAPVAVRFYANVGLRKLKRSGLFEVGAGGKVSFWRKRVLIQQRRRGGWRTVKSIVLTDSWAAGAGFAGSAATFRPRVPKGSLIRAFLPLSQARPCYLAGVSDPVRT